MAQLGTGPAGATRYMVSNQNIAASPGIGAVLTSVTVPAPGWYQVTAEHYYTGTIALSPDADNIALQSDPVTSGAMVSQAVLLCNPNVASSSFQPPSHTCWVYALSTIQLIAIVAGSTGSAYHVTLRAIPT